MSKLVLIQAAAGALHGAFRRLGQTFTSKGVVVDATSYSEEDWKVLVEEPMLHIGPAPEGVAPADDAALREAVRVAIGGLEAADFDKDGAPKLAAIKKALGGKVVTAALLAEVWAEVKPAT